MQYDETSFMQMQMALCYHTIVVTVAKLIAVSLLFPVQWIDVIIELVFNRDGCGSCKSALSMINERVIG